MLGSITGQAFNELTGSVLISLRSILSIQRLPHLNHSLIVAIVDPKGPPDAIGIDACIFVQVSICSCRGIRAESVSLAKESLGVLCVKQGMSMCDGLELPSQVAPKDCQMHIRKQQIFIPQSPSSCCPTPLTILLRLLSLCANFDLMRVENEIEIEI